jgi:hypothetical protein
MVKEKVNHTLNDHMENMMNDSRKAFKEFLSVGKIEDKIDYSCRRAVSK